MFDAKKFIEKKGVPQGTISIGVIIEVKDGIVKEFISPELVPKWQGDINGKAIQVSIENLYNGAKFVTKKMFTYNQDADGSIVLTPKSNLAKYKKTYGKLPETSDKVNLMANEEGYFQIIY